jgi:hypothetical protein
MLQYIIIFSQIRFNVILHSGPVITDTPQTVLLFLKRHLSNTGMGEVAALTMQIIEEPEFALNRQFLTRGPAICDM